jgi:CheY-like chemotaxis protein
VTDPSVIPILVLGDSRRGEFAAARAVLAGSADVVDAGSIDEAVSLVDDGRFAPAVIVIAQSYPGEFSGEAIDRLRRCAPLARMVGLLGSWCEGETRSGHPWPGTIRLYWHQWVPQAGRELATLLGPGTSGWSLPSTASDEERLLATPSLAGSARDGLVALCVERHETHDWLAAALTRRGYSTVWLRPGQRTRLGRVRAAVFDAPSMSEAGLAPLGPLRATVGPEVPIVALADFPRVEDHQRLRSAGASAVLSKPLLVDDLYWQLDRLAVAPH